MENLEYKSCHCRPSISLLEVIMLDGMFYLKSEALKIPSYTYIFITGFILL